ncbi:MAG: hypothetical protein OSB75_09925 [Dehalococcoidia bacterium]|nr:hypothetical protein [Dehalococcoidia bacterium]
MSAGEVVLIVEAEETGDSDLAFPLGVIGGSAANADVGEDPIVVFTASQGRHWEHFSGLWTERYSRLTAKTMIYSPTVRPPAARTLLGGSLAGR